MDSQTKTKAVNLEDLQISVREVFNKGFGNSGTCTTAAATPAKEVTLGTIFSLVTGCALLVKFTHGITSENSTLAVTHTINGSSVTETAKPIYLNGTALAPRVIPEGAILILRYNGTQFDIVGGAGQGGGLYTEGDGIDIANGSISVDDSVARLGADGQSVILPEFVPGIFVGSCSTAADTAAKTLDITGYELVRKSGVAVTFTNGISVASATLNISSKGAKPIYFRGAALAANVVLAGDIVTMVYNGTQYEIISIERKPVYAQIGNTGFYSMTI